MRTLAIVAGVTVAATLLAACGAARAPRSEPHADAPHWAAPLGLATRSRTDRSCTEFRPTARRVYAAVVLRSVVVHKHARLTPRDVNGYQTVLGVLGARLGLDCRPLLFHVQLPGPPNGRTGWIEARAVRVFAVSDRLVVDLSARRLVAYRNGRPRLRARVAVGAPQTPTPTGRFVVNERWLLDNPNGVFGVAALGISAHSDVLHAWLQDGPIALHGTNEPWTIGEAASHGCIRLRNAEMRRLLPLAPAGTPVEIVR
jgi:L,D-transpeptidase catalytic domain